MSNDTDKKYDGPIPEWVTKSLEGLPKATFKAGGFHAEPAPPPDAREVGEDAEAFARKLLLDDTNGYIYTVAGAAKEIAKRDAARDEAKARECEVMRLKAHHAEQRANIAEAAEQEKLDKINHLKHLLEAWYKWQAEHSSAAFADADYWFVAETADAILDKEGA